MKNSKIFLRTAAGLLMVSGTLLPGVAVAHDIWSTVDKLPNEKYVADVGYGDRDDRSMPDPEKMVVFDVVGPDGTTSLRHPLKLSSRLGHPTIKSAPFSLQPGSVIAISYDNGFWAKLPGDKGQTNTTELMVKGPVTEKHWTVKYSKMLFGLGSYKRIAGQRMELTALKDPFTLKKGEMLPVRVDYEGKPIAGIEIQYDDGVSPVSDANSPKVKTGGDGVAMIPLNRRGPYLLSADSNEPVTDKRFADYDHVFGSLSFDLTK